MTGLKARHTYVAGAVRYRDLAYTASHDDAVPKHIEHTHFHEVDGSNLGYIGAVNWATVSMAVSVLPRQQMIAMSPHGDVKLFGSGHHSDEQIATADGAPQTRGMLRKLRTIDQRTWAVGMGRQVYRREGDNDWRCLDQSIRPAAFEVKGFESIDGFSSTDIYAAGWDGEIWHFDGQRWQQQTSPTDVVLTDVVCGGDGNVYIAGRGVLLRGRGDHWQRLEPALSDVEDLAWYRDTLFIATSRGVFALVDDTPVNVLDCTSGTLSTADGVLWSFGEKDVMAFDGHSWTRVD